MTAEPDLSFWSATPPAITAAMVTMYGHTSYGRGPERRLPPQALAADLLLRTRVPAEKLCAECGHRFTDHGDRALAACAPDRGTDVGGMPITTSCWCRGWKRYAL